MVGNYNLFPVGSTGFESGKNPLALGQKDTAVTQASWTDNAKKNWDALWSGDYFKVPGQESVKDVYRFFDFLTEGSTWKRGGIVVIGIIFLAIGLYLLGNKPATVVIQKLKGD